MLLVARSALPRCSHRNVVSIVWVYYDAPGPAGARRARAALKLGGRMPDTLGGRSVGFADRRAVRDTPTASLAPTASPPELLPLVYQSLKELARQRMALERPGHTLQA